MTDVSVETALAEPRLRAVLIDALNGIMPDADDAWTILHAWDALAVLHARSPDGLTEALTDALEDVAEFLGTVTEWTGSSGEELSDALDVIDRALAAAGQPATTEDEQAPAPEPVSLKTALVCEQAERMRDGDEAA